MRLLTLLLCFELLVASATLIGQERAQLSGFIWDSSKSLVPGVVITATNEETGFTYKTVSGADGTYDFPYLLPGRYKLTVRRENFRTLVRSGLALSALQGARIDFDLQVGDVREVVTVNDTPVFLNSRDASVGTLIGRNGIDRLPLEGRAFLPLIELAPGTVITPATNGEAGQFSVNGQRPNANYFTLDGVSVNTGVSGGGLPAQLPGGSLPNVTAFGSVHSITSVEALDESRLQTSTLTPEYGRVPGGQVVLSSRSGSNEFHGLIADTVRTGATDANDWFANSEAVPRANLRYQDFAGTLGGPIRRNRTFFFASYEGLRLKQTYAWSTVVPAIEIRQTAPTFLRPILQAFPEPNGSVLGGGAAALLGATARPSSSDGGSIRVDHALGPKLTLLGRYSVSPSSTNFGLSQINRLELHSQSITVGLTAVLNPEITSELRVNYSAARADSAWQTGNGESPFNCASIVALLGATISCPSSARILIGGLGQIITGTDGFSRQRQWNVAETASFHLGSHSVRIGANYIRWAPQRDVPPLGVTITSSGIEDLVLGNYTVALSQAQRAATSIQEVAIFAQDTWNIGSRFTLTYGVRWELAPPPTVPRPLTIFEPPPPYPGISAGNIPVWRVSFGDFAPRIGAAYRLTRSGNTVLRAGFSLYYDPDFGVATDGINGAPYNTWQFNSGASYQNNPSAATVLTYGYAHGLRLPRVSEWNVTVERALTNSDSLSLGYIGSSANELLRHELTPDGTALIQTIMATNNGQSDYNSLQAQYRRRISAGLQGLISYTWAHSIDNGSADSGLYLSTSQLPHDRGSSDFDVRHSLVAALSYQLPSGPVLQRIFHGWSVDAMFRARTGFPVDVRDAQTEFGLGFADIFRPNRVPYAPIWLNDASVPGGKRLNRNAFEIVPGNQGTLGRNSISGFGMSQLDLSARRSFSIRDKYALELRAEAFNALNHANFGDPESVLDSPLFGQSTSMLNLMLGSGSPGTGLTPAFQIGGPRALQFSLRFRF